MTFSDTELLRDSREISVIYFSSTRHLNVSEGSDEDRAVVVPAYWRYTTGNQIMPSLRNIRSASTHALDKLDIRYQVTQIKMKHLDRFQIQCIFVSELSSVLEGSSRKQFHGERREEQCRCQPPLPPVTDITCGFLSTDCDGGTSGFAQPTSALKSKLYVEDIKTGIMHNKFHNPWSVSVGNSQPNIKENMKMFSLAEPDFSKRRKVLLQQLLTRFFDTHPQRVNSLEASIPWWIEYQSIPKQEIVVHMMLAQTRLPYTTEPPSSTHIFNSGMRKEFTRYGSFEEWPQGAAAWPSKLASAGFYYGGSRDQVTCFSCGVVQEGWTLGAKPIVVHRQISPGCLFLATGAGNIPILEDSRAEECLRQIGRQIQSGVNQRSGGATSLPVVSQRPTSQETLTDPETYPSSGYFSMQATEENEPLSTIHECISEEVQNSTTAFVPSPSTQFLCARIERDSLVLTLNQQSSNVREPHSSAPPRNTDPAIQPTVPLPSPRAAGASGGSREPRFKAEAQSMIKPPDSSNEFGGTLGISIDRPKNPLYAVTAIRVNTFSQKWPHSSFLSPVDLAEAGYYYSGYGDSVKCFFCAIGLKNWDRTDNPWLEHARWSPKCAYLNQSRGVDFVNWIQKLSKNGDQISYKQVMDILKDSQSSQAGEHSPVRENLVEIPEIGSKNSETEGSSLLEENEEMKEQTLCKVCMDREVAIVFLPCGHLSCCTECAPALRECPICRSKVRGTVRAYMG